MASITRRRTTTGESRYDVRYRLADGQVRTRTLRTRKDAQRLASTVEADMLRGAWVDPRESSRRFGELALLWLESNPAKRPSAWARDESIIRVHLAPVLGEEPLGKVTPARVQALVRAWSDGHQPRTVRRMYGVLRAIFSYAVESNFLVSSPCRAVKLPLMEPMSRRVVDADELGLLGDELGPDFAVMPYVGAMLGLRWGEVAGLRVGRLDFLAGTLAVAEQVTRGVHGRSVFGPPKSAAGRRTLAMPSTLVDMLAAHLTRRGLTAVDAEVLLFTTADGEVLDYANFRHRVWLPACARAGLAGLTFHDLRRANATALVRAGVDLKTAQTRLGHSDPRLTLGVYAQATGEADRAAADVLGANFSRRPRDERAMDSA